MKTSSWVMKARLIKFVIAILALFVVANPAHTPKPISNSFEEAARVISYYFLAKAIAEAAQDLDLRSPPPPQSQ